MSEPGQRSIFELSFAHFFILFDYANFLALKAHHPLFCCFKMKRFTPILYSIFTTLYRYVPCQMSRRCATLQALPWSALSNSSSHPIICQNKLYKQPHWQEHLNQILLIWDRGFTRVGIVVDDLKYLSVMRISKQNLSIQSSGWRGWMAEHQV